MQSIASILGLGTAIILFVYFVLLSPHFVGILWGHFKHGWFLAGMAAFLWVPLILMHVGKN